jgi:phosphatidylglycerol:prolipoprotein diacylglycerol transferase
MHPVLLQIPIHWLAPLLKIPVIVVVTAVVAYVSFRLRRVRGGSTEESVNAALFPAGLSLVLMLVIRGSQTPWPLHTYGVLIALGFIFGIGVAVREARRTGFDDEAILDMGFWALVSGMVGARLYFIAVNWREYFVTRAWVRVDGLPFEVPAVLAVWQGGLVFYGGILGAVAAFFWFARKRKLPVGQFADVFIIGVPLGHAFGRMGCFAAGCCWGDAAYHLQATGEVVATFPFAAQFPKESLAYGSLLRTAEPHLHGLMVQAGHTLPLYPTQLMESLGELLIFGTLIVVRSRKAFHGQVAATYFLMYPVLRATLEFFRGDPERGWIVDRVLSVGQFTSILVAAGSLAVIVMLSARNRASLVPAAIPPAPSP